MNVSTGENPIHILIVDDDPEIVLGHRRVLEKAGYVCTTASSGAETLDAISSNQPDLILLDRDLPDGDGLEICRRIKGDPAYANISVIIMSGVYTTTDDRAGGLESGADGYFVRPISNRELLARVQAYVRMLHMSRSLREKSRALEEGNRELARSRVAALNLMEDAVAAQKRAESALRELQEREKRLRTLSTAVEQSGSIVFITDESARIVYVNPSFTEVTGYGADEVIGKNPRILKSGMMPRETYADFWNTLRSGRTWRGEFYNRKKDGSHYWALVSASPVVDESGRITHFTGVQEDITRRKEAEESLREREQQLGERLKELSALHQTAELFQDMSLPEPEMIERIAHLLPGAYRSPEIAAARVSFGNCLSETEGFDETKEAQSSTFHSGGTEGVLAVCYREPCPEGAGDPFLPEEQNMLDAMAEMLSAWFDRKRAAENLSRSEKQLARAESLAHLGSWEGDLETEAINWSDELYRIMGLDPAAVVPDFTRVLQCIHPEDRDRVTRLHHETLSTGRGYEDTHRIVRSDRTERFVNVRTVMEMDKNGKPIRSIGTVQDVTELVLAEQRLRSSEERARALIENATDVIFTLTATGVIASLNPAFEQLTGWPREEWIGKEYPPIIHPDDLELAGDMLEMLLRGERPPNSEMRVATAAGDYRICDFSVTPLVMQRSELVILGVVRDVTERAKAEETVRQLNETLEQRVEERTEELAAANRELEAFSYSVSHDLRAPLRAIDGFSNIMLEDYGAGLDPEAARYFEMIRGSVKRMGDLIDDLLAFSRLGRQPVEKRRVEPREIVDAALEELAHERKGREIEIEIGELPPCEADPGLLRQVYVNLLGNALKYTGKCERARIDVGARAADNGAPPVFYVKDNGAGFDMKYAHKLFGVFQRLHTASEFEGTGVGLANVRRIVERHGGRICAEAAPGKGAKFYFTLAPERKGSLDDLCGKGEVQ